MVTPRGNKVHTKSVIDEEFIMTVKYKIIQLLLILHAFQMCKLANKCMQNLE